MWPSWGLLGGGGAHGGGGGRGGGSRPRYPGSLLGRFYLLDFRGKPRTPSRGAPGRRSLPRSQTFLRAPSEGASLGSAPVYISDVNVSKPPGAGGRGLTPTPRGRLRVPGTQKWGMQPKGQPRSRPKFPPKLRWPRRDPGALGPQRRVGTGVGWSVGSRPNGTSRKVNAKPGPGGKQPAPGPFTSLVQGWRPAPNLSPHLLGAAPSPGHVGA